MPIVGDVLAGRYRIDAPIGAGGMASVYRAYDLRLERDVAVKVLLPNLAADATLAQRFEREALALAATAHPSVVKVFDVEPGDPGTGREPFYVMELCDGGSLADRLVARGRLEPAEIVAAVTAIADGLADLHRRGFVHRDVKPHNILFDQGRARLADFGLARPEERSDLPSLTVTGATVGTLAYLAPELVAGAPATAASDVYALGVVAFQGLTGRLPRPVASMTELVASHREPAPPVSSAAPELGDFDGPVGAALAMEPDVRPDPRTFAEGLDRVLGGPRARRGAAAARPVVPVAGSAAVVLGPTDPTAATVEDVRAGPLAGPETARREPTGPRPAVVALGALALLFLALLALSARPGGDPGADATAPAATPVATPSPAPTPSASPVPTPIPTPTPPPVDPAAEAYAVLDRIDAAIEDLADEDDIRDRDLDALRRRAGDVRNALAASDYDEARARAARLDDEVDRVDDRVDGQAMEDLKDAVSSLDEAIPSD